MNIVCCCFFGLPLFHQGLSVQSKAPCGELTPRPAAARPEVLAVQMDRASRESGRLCKMFRVQDISHGRVCHSDPPSISTMYVLVFLRTKYITRSV